jgi:hypothetical protein
LALFITVGLGCALAVGLLLGGVVAAGSGLLKLVVHHDQEET